MLVLFAAYGLSGTALDTTATATAGDGLAGKTFLVLGDSYTAAHGLSSKQQGWTYVMAEIWSMTQYNYSISGSSMTYGGWVPMVERVFDLPEDIQPDFIILQGGSNDRSQSLPIGSATDTGNDTFYGALNIILDTLEEKYPNATIVCFTPWINDPENLNDLGLGATDYVAAMMDVCETRNIICYNASDTDSNGMYLNEEWFRAKYCLNSTDYYHLNATGSAMFAEIFGVWLQKTLYGMEVADQFYDLAISSDELRDAVSTLFLAGVFSGTSKHLFSPTKSATRQTLAVTLYRLAGSPGGTTRELTDVKEGSETYSAVCWCMDMGIFQESDTFSPGTYITRSDLAVALYRYYVNYMGGSADALTGVGTYSDRNALSQEAAVPMSWALTVGVMSDVDGELRPQSLVSRGQLALALSAFKDLT